MYTRFRDVLAISEQQECIQILDEPTWAFFGRSNDVDFSFWYKELIDKKFFNNIFFNKILLLTGKKLKLERLYANGQTHGLPGSLHEDDHRENSWTFLYYANPYWEVQWGGETVFYKNEKDYGTAQLIPNTAIFFKGNMLHAGLEPTRHFKGLRMTVAFKLLEIE